MIRVAWLLASFILVSMMSPFSAGAVIDGRLVGDVNCDDVVDSRDARDILKYHAGLLEELDCFWQSTVDGYVEVNSIDALLILKFHAGLIDHLPPIRTFVGTIVLARGIEADCLALDTGDDLYGVWDLGGASEGDRVKVVGFLNIKMFFICGVHPVIANSSIETLS